MLLSRMRHALIAPDRLQSLPQGQIQNQKIPVEIKYLPIIELMLQKADVYGIDFKARTTKGKTLFQLALSDGYEEIVSLLKKYNIVS